MPSEPEQGCQKDVGGQELTRTVMAMSFSVVSVDSPSSTNFFKISFTKLSLNFFKAKQKLSNWPKMRSKIQTSVIKDIDKGKTRPFRPTII